MEASGWTDKVGANAAKRGMEGLEQGFHALAPGVLKGKMVGMHRTRQMIGMTSGWLVGNYLGNIMAGQDLDHHPIAKEDVPLSLQFLHGSLNYNAYSDNPHDRKLKVVHQLMGGAMGGVGAVAGSNSFFVAGGTRDKLEKIMGKKAHELTMFEADHAASAAQAGVWRVFAAVLGSFSSSSGMAMVMWLNFSTGINSVFNSMLNRKAGTELFELHPLNKISNTVTSIPYGPSEVMPRMARYFATVDAAESPDMLKAEGMKYLHATLKPLFPQLTKEQEENMLQTVNAIRSKALADKKDVGKEIEKQFTGVNFENMLRDNGIDPTTAQLGNHGLLTRVSHAMSKLMFDVFGVEKKTVDIHERFKEGVRLRQEAQGASR